MGEHGIKSPCPDAGKKPGTSHDRDVVSGFPTGLGDDAGPETMGDQETPEQGHGKGGVIHIRIPADEQNIELIPPKTVHLRPAHGQKTRLVESIWKIKEIWHAHGYRPAKERGQGRKKEETPFSRPWLAHFFKNQYKRNITIQRGFSKSKIFRARNSIPRIYSVQNFYIAACCSVPLDPITDQKMYQLQ
jgi:hypothetical protein